jgi:general secretion pathway protein I
MGAAIETGELGLLRLLRKCRRQTGQGSVMVPARGPANSGFMLLELLVAFAIAALCLGILMRIFSTGLHGMSEAEAYRRATIWAESVLDGIGAGAPLREGESAGELGGGLRWSARVASYGGDDREGTPAFPVRAYMVGVTVSWRAAFGEKSVALTTVRLQPVLQAGDDQRAN